MFCVVVVLPEECPTTSILDTSKSKAGKTNVIPVFPICRKAPF